MLRCPLRQDLKEVAGHRTFKYYGQFLRVIRSFENHRKKGLMDEALEHHGVKGMKWGVRRTPEQLGYPSKLSVGDKDSAITKRVKNDYNRMDERQFKAKYQTSKKTYAKRVARSSTGDPFSDRRKSMPKKAFDYSVKKEIDLNSSKRLAAKAEKHNQTRSVGSRAITTVLIGSRGNTAYNTLRASGYTKKGSAAIMALTGTEGAMNRADRAYKNSASEQRVRSRETRMYHE